MCTETNEGFDYEVIYKCQYPVARGSSPGNEDDCGDPATFRGYWGDDEMLLCQFHVEECIRQVRGPYE